MWPAAEGMTMFVSNGAPFTQYPAAAGYDYTTGLGSFDLAVMNSQIGQ